MRSQPGATGSGSPCKSCASSRLVGLNAEICLTFPGLSDLNKAPIFVFQSLVLCGDCGFMESKLSAADIVRLSEYLGRS